MVWESPWFFFLRDLVWSNHSVCEIFHCSSFWLHASFILLLFTALDTVPLLLHALCSGPMTPQQHLETQQALAKQFAEILHFTLKFDDLKVGIKMSLFFQFQALTPFYVNMKSKFEINTLVLSYTVDLVHFCAAVFKRWCNNQNEKIRGE